MQIRADVDRLVQNCLIYKDDFENRCQESEFLADSIREYVRHSDNPREAIVGGVEQLQNSLNRIPMLRETVSGRRYDFALGELSYA